MMEETNFIIRVSLLDRVTALQFYCKLNVRSQDTTVSEFSNMQKQNKNKLYESISKTLTQASISTTFP